LAFWLAFSSKAIMPLLLISYTSLINFTFFTLSSSLLLLLALAIKAKDKNIIV
jgi:hypothetical protein